MTRDTIKLSILEFLTLKLGDKRRRGDEQLCIGSLAQQNAPKNNGNWTRHGGMKSLTVKEEEFQDEAASGIETETVEQLDDGKIRFLKGQALQIKSGQLKAKDFGKFMRSATYRKLSQKEGATRQRMTS